MLRETSNRRPFIAGARRMPFAAGWLAWALVCAGALGCGGVQRRLTIRSNPPGALVYIDKYEIGRTPCSVSFVYYGKREFKLVKDGCETLTVDRWIVPPWYQVFGLDFITENLSPIEIRDER
ncbi:MAG TPA: PEGA domain-containing protein, partial [Pirellulales bacterium]|nr:PEGA domain-containing protein [Pirellulales bacterium]